MSDDNTYESSLQVVHDPLNMSLEGDPQDLLQIDRGQLVMVLQRLRELQLLINTAQETLRESCVWRHPAQFDRDNYTWSRPRLDCRTENENSKRSYPAGQPVMGPLSCAACTLADKLEKLK